MQITEQVTRRVLGVEGNDEYGIDLVLGKKRVSLSLAQSKTVREAMAEAEVESVMARNQLDRDLAERLLREPLADWEQDILDGKRVNAAAAPEALDERTFACRWCGAPSQGRAYQVADGTYPARSCGEHGFGFVRDEVAP